MAALEGDDSAGIVGGLVIDIVVGRGPRRWQQHWEDRRLHGCLQWWLAALEVRTTAIMGWSAGLI